MLLRLVPYLERVSLRLGETIHRAGGPLQHAHFPTTAIVSLRGVLQSGASAQIASVGNEGVLGISLFMSGGMTTNSAVVQTAGLGYRLKARWLQEEFNRAGLEAADCECHGVLRHVHSRLRNVSRDRSAAGA